MCQNHKVLIILLPSVRVTSQYWEYTTANPEKWCNTSQYVPHSLVKHLLPPDTAGLLTASHESGGFHTSRVLLLWHARTCRHRGALCIILGPEAQGTSTTMLKLLSLRLPWGIVSDLEACAFYQHLWNFYQTNLLACIVLLMRVLLLAIFHTIRLIYVGRVLKNNS